MTENDFPEAVVRQAFSEAYCLSSVVRSLGLSPNGTTLRFVQRLQQLYAIDTKHFDKQGVIHVLYFRTAFRPVCGNDFETSDRPRARATCSYACANTLFRSGERNGRWKSGASQKYAAICWRYHEKRCVVCSEELVVAVHHLNGNHKDNRPENLVPLCPTHHTYWHSKHRYRIKDSVMDYVSRFKEKQTTGGHDGSES